jgi:hypothetical protein
MKPAWTPRKRPMSTSSRRVSPTPRPTSGMRPRPIFTHAKADGEMAGLLLGHDSSLRISAVDSLIIALFLFLFTIYEIRIQSPQR